MKARTERGEVVKHAAGMMCVAALVFVSRPASADPLVSRASQPMLVRFHVDWLADTRPVRPSGLSGVQFEPREPARAARAGLLPTLAVVAAAVPAVPDQGFEYSPGYQARDRIHHAASYAMLPLFGLEAYLGEQLFAHPEESRTWKRGAHGAVAVAIGGVFAVNSVTGLWNLKEARKDPVGAHRRVAHAVLMLVADGAYLATAVTTPSNHLSRAGLIDESGRRLHRGLAYASVSVATVGYLLMFFR
jgi:hypothetical protein